MREVGILDARTNFSALVAEVEADGEPVLITRHGRPVARLSAAGESRLSGVELAERFRQIRERAAAEFGKAPFDWKAAVEDGRE